MFFSLCHSGAHWQKETTNSFCYWTFLWVFFSSRRFIIWLFFLFLISQKESRNEIHSAFVEWNKEEKKNILMLISWARFSWRNLLMKSIDLMTRASYGETVVWKLTFEPWNLSAAYENLSEIWRQRTMMDDRFMHLELWTRWNYLYDNGASYESIISITNQFRILGP